MSGQPEGLRRWGRAALQILALVARPARRAQGSRGVVVEPYRGYGSGTQVFLIGRVFRQRNAEGGAEAETLQATLRDIGRRIRRRAVRDVTVVARIGRAEQQVRTDRDGYYRITLDTPEAAGGTGDAWHPVALSVQSDPPVEAEGRCYIPPAGSRLVIISDIDDTVMRTGVANKLVMLWRLFVADADDRVAFPGVGAFYRALHRGVGGREGNAILYVSRAPWGTYDMLTAFFRRHRIPVGPELFLREWGLSWRHPWPRRAEDHKRELITRMMALFPDRPFVLIGDSGQHDPEVYARVVEAHPGRVKAIYIRDVSRSRTRTGEVDRLKRAIASSGADLVLTADSVVMAEHALRIGLVSAETVAAVAEDRGDIVGADESEPDPPARQVP